MVLQAGAVASDEFKTCSKSWEKTADMAGNFSRTEGKPNVNLPPAA